MPTTKKRINISISKELDSALSAFAKRDQMPQATKAEYFLRIGIELEEDILIEKIVSNRYKTTKKSISHKEIWGK